MVERKTRVPGRDQHSHGSGTAIGAGTSGLVLELLCLPRVAQGSGQGVPPSPGVRGLPFSGAGADTGSPLEFPSPSPWGGGLAMAVMGSGSFCCTPCKATDTVTHIIPFLPAAETRSGRT